MKARKTEETVLPIKYVKLGDFALESIITHSSCVWKFCGEMYLNQQGLALRSIISHCLGL